MRASSGSQIEQWSFDSSNQNKSFTEVSYISESEADVILQQKFVGDYNFSILYGEHVIDEKVENLKNHQLEKYTKHIRAGSAAMSLEIRSLERFIDLHHLQIFSQLPAAAVATGGTGASHNSSNIDLKSLVGTAALGGHSRVSFSHASSAFAERNIKLEPEKKFEIVLEIVEDTKANKRKIRNLTKTHLAKQKRMNEEIRQYSLDKSSMLKDLKEQITNMQKKRITKGIKYAEELVRYLEDRNKKREIYAGQLRLRSCTIQTEKMRLAVAMRQKEEMGEFMHPIEIQQLEIENELAQREQSDLGRKLLLMKQHVGELNRMKNKNKDHLQHLIGINEHLKGSIEWTKVQIQKTEADLENTCDDLDAAQVRKQHMLDQLDKFQIPSLMDYVGYSATKRTLEEQKKYLAKKIVVCENVSLLHK